MTTPRLVISALVSVAAMFVAMACLPATGLAQGNISIVSAGPDASGDPYDLTVVADDANGLILTSMTVHFLQGSTDVYDVSDMQYDGSSPADAQIWTPATPIPSTDLPAGTYTMTVDASDSSPETDDGLPAGTITITYGSTNVAVAPSQTDVTEGSQDVTFSGSVTGTAEDGTQVPMPGVQVNVSDGNSVTTDSNGDFSYTASGISQTTDYDFTVAAAQDGSYPAGDSGSITITAEQAATSVQVTAGAPVYSDGSESITFTGTVTAISPINSASVPVTGATVNITADSGTESLPSTTTDSNGDFTYTATDVTTTTDYDFSVGPNNLYTQGNDDVPLNSGSAALTNLAASPPEVTEGSNSVTFTGTVTVTPPDGTATGIGSGVPVYLCADGVPQGQAVATTDDADGDFSYGPVTGIAQTTDYEFCVTATSLYGEADQTIQVVAVAGTTAISVTPPSADVTLGSQSVTFTGTVTVTPPTSSSTPPGTTTPQNIGAGIPVDLTGASNNPVATTNASGQFTYTASGVDAATNLTFTIAGTNLYSDASAQASIGTQQAQTIFSNLQSSVITFGSPTATLSGTVEGLPPDGSTYLGIPGAQVDVNGTPGPTTDSSGNFSYTTGDLTAQTDYDLTVPSASLYSEGDSGEVSVAVDPGTTTVSQITTSPPVIGLGPQTVTFSGHVSVTPYGSTTAEPIGSGVAVDVSTNGTAGEPVTTDDASGDFSDTISGVTPGMVYTFSVGSDYLYGQASQSMSFDKAQTTLSVTPSRQSITEGSQNITFKGTFTGAEAGGASQPIAGAPVDLGSTRVATTNDEGAFSYTIKDISRATSYHFSVAGTNTYGQASASVPVAVSPAKTRFHALSVTPAHLRYGQKATLRGTVQYLSGKTWTNLPRGSVQVAEGKADLGIVRSNSKGSFTASLPTTHGAGWSAMLNSATLTQAASTVGNLSIAVPTKLQSFKIGLGVNGEVSANGCLEVTVPVGYSPLTKIAIQYAAASRGPWKTLGQLQLRDIGASPRACGAATESYFSGSIRVKLANAYYRADFPSSYSFESVASKPVHLWKYETRITGYTVSPRSVKTGQRVTITGQLWAKTKGWQPFANQKVEIVYNDKGTSYWGSLGTAKTNSHGDFKAYALGGAGSFVAIIYGEYGGGKTDFAVRSTGEDLSINPHRSSFAASAGTPAAGTPAAGTAQAADPAAAGSGLPVILQPGQLGFADAVQEVLTATSELTSQDGRP